MTEQQFEELIKVLKDINISLYNINFELERMNDNNFGPLEVN